MGVLLAVSNGTAEEGTLSALETALGRAFPDRRLVRAFTSAFFRQRRQERGCPVDSVPEALERLLAQGYGDVAVQPLLVAEGRAYGQLLEMVRPYRGRFRRLAVGAPLLAGDCRDAAQALPLPPLAAGRVTVFVGHGGTGSGSFARLEGALAAIGRRDVKIVPMEDLEDLGRRLEGEALCLRPLLLTAGRHASRDIFPWKERLEALGWSVTWTAEGLGMCPAVQAVFVRRLRAALESG